MFNVIYLDDENRKHLTIAANLSELKFLLERFDKVNYEPIR